MAKVTMRVQYTDDEWGLDGLGDLIFFFDNEKVPFVIDVVSMAERLCGKDADASILVCDCAKDGVAWHAVGDIITSSPDEQSIRWQFETDWKIEGGESKFFSNTQIFPQNDRCIEFDRVQYARTTLAAIETLIASAMRRNLEEGNVDRHSFFLMTALPLVRSLKKLPGVTALDIPLMPGTA